MYRVGVVRVASVLVSDQNEEINAGAGNREVPVGRGGGRAWRVDVISRGVVMYAFHMLRSIYVADLRM